MMYNYIDALIMLFR